MTATWRASWASCPPAAMRSAPLGRPRRPAHRTGIKDIAHPVVGDLDLTYEVMGLSADPGLRLVAYTAEAGSPADDGLRVLASWAATHEPADALATPDQQT